MIEVLASSYVLLGLIIILVEIRRIKFGQTLNALSFFNAVYFLLFCFAPLNILIIGETAVRQKYAYQTWGHGDIGTAATLIAAYLIFTVAYNRSSVVQNHVSAVPLRERSASIAGKIIWMYLIIGIGSMAYHISLVGGVVDVLNLAPRIRSGQYELKDKMIFIRQFCTFLATAFMLHWALYVDRNNAQKRLGRGIAEHYYFGLTACLFIFYALSTYGRREFYIPLIICLAASLLGTKMRSWWKVSWLVVLTVVWYWTYSYVTISAPHASEIEKYIESDAIATVKKGEVLNRITDYNATYISLVQGLSDSFMHFVASQHAKLWQFGFLTDIRELPIQFIPTKLLGIERDRGMYGHTSEFILGKPLDTGLSGEEPLGLHGYLLVNFGYPGLFLLFYVAGSLYAKMDSKLRPRQGDDALGWVLFMWVVVGGLEFLREGVVVLILKPKFSWWLAIGILLWYRSLYERKKVHRQYI